MSRTAIGSDSVLDPITVEVIGSSFMSITDEMSEALIKASYSTTIKERRDCSTALCNAGGEVLCQAEHIPVHLGSFLTFVPLLLKRFPPHTIRPGDVFLGNDAYEGGGSHLPDFVMAEPLFVDGRIAAWAINTAHHADFADRGHAHIYQEGLRIPPVRLMRAGVLQEDVQDLILLNCQVPHERLSDLRAQMAANRVGATRLAALLAKYGTPVVFAAGKALQDYAERRMRAAISKISDGVYAFEDVFESTEIRTPMKLGVEITVLGDEMTLRFSAPPQVRAGANMVMTALAAAVYYAVKAAVDPQIPPNAGMGRPIKIEAPLGSLLNCRPPAAVHARMGPAQRVVDVVLGALAKALPNSIPAASSSASAGALFSGVHPHTQQAWMYLDGIGGGGGARPNKDGLSGIQVHLTNTSNLPVEALESEFPLTVMRYELIDGSGGDGKFRGGMGIRRVCRAEVDCRVEIEASRITSAPWGLAGGAHGASTFFKLNSQPVTLEGGALLLKAGQIFEISTPGGGGYGDPASRNPAARRRDEVDAGDRRLASQSG
jgi:N-methylhydantoinase B